MTDLTGNWIGSYTYPDCLSPVPFTAEIRDLGGPISGVTSEPHEWTTGEEAHGTISGERSGSNVQFMKVYIQQEDYMDPVHYYGTLDEDECELAGEWDIPGEWSGSFVMTRPKPRRAAATAEQQAEV
jgi:hypothetical protein